MIAPVAGTDRTLTFPAQLPRTESVPVLGGLVQPVARIGGPVPARPTGAAGRALRRRSATSASPTSSTPPSAAAPTTPWSCGSARRRRTSGGPRPSTPGTAASWPASRTRPIVVRGSQPIGIPACSRRRSAGRDRHHRRARADVLRRAAGTERDLRRRDPDPRLLPRPHGVPAPRRLTARRRAARQGQRVHRRQPATARHRRRAARVRSDSRSRRTSNSSTRRRRSRRTALRELAAQVTATQPTTYDKVLALERWMGAHTKYTLDIPPLPAGAGRGRPVPLRRPGGLLRADRHEPRRDAALARHPRPARVGYATGERNPFTGLYEVRAKDAHAWAEVYFPGSAGRASTRPRRCRSPATPPIHGAGTGALAYLNARINVPAWAVADDRPARGARRRRVACSRTASRRAAPPSRAGRAELGRDPARAARTARRAPRAAPAHPARPRPSTPPRSPGSTRSPEPDLLTIARVLDAAMFSAEADPPSRPRHRRRALADLDERWRRRPKPRPSRCSSAPEPALRRPARPRRSRPSPRGGRARRGTPAARRPSPGRTPRRSAPAGRGARPPSAAVVTPSTVPAAIAVRSIAP